MGGIEMTAGPFRIVPAPPRMAGACFALELTRTRP